MSDLILDDQEEEFLTDVKHLKNFKEDTHKWNYYYHRKKARKNKHEEERNEN